MNLDKHGQQALLKLSELDLEIARLRLEITRSLESAELKEINDELSSSSEDLLEARTKFENLEVAVKRAEEDLKLVTDRLLRDKERLNQTSSPKDAMGIQSEINTLNDRKDDLETTELELLAELEQAEGVLNSISSHRKNLAEKLEEEQQKIQQRVDELKSRGRKASADREIVLAKIPAAVLEKYSKLAAKQIAVAQIEDRSCTACRMNLTVGAIDSLSSLAEDELGSCPECQAIIIR
ncbi:MAG: zinc ribbon domain-containing protein [Rhodoluna sp.]